MGRLFWKVFLMFWITMLVMALLTAAGIQALRDDDEDPLFSAPDARDGAVLLINRRAEERLIQYAAILQHGGASVLRDVMRQTGGRAPHDRLSTWALATYVVDERGNDLLGRTVPAPALDAARQATTAGDRGPGAWQVKSPTGQAWWLFIPRPSDETRRRRRPGYAGEAPRFAPIAAGLFLFSVSFSALLAWYLASPIKALRDGMRRVAGGDLNTRVADRIGARRDELADLGRDFDGTTGRIAQLLQSQKRLLHDVSHELRSPLARLQAAIGLLQQSPARAPELARRIETESQRLDLLVGEILTLARLDEGAGQMPTDRIDLDEMLADLVDDARFEAGARDQTIVLKGQIQRSVQGHAQLLRRAVENIIRNAIKYSPASSTIEVHLSVPPAGVDDDTALVTIAVLDRGPGLPPDQLAHVLEPFVRGPAVQTADIGFGLGLAIAQRAARLHGGELSLANRDGGGLIASITLPAVPLAEKPPVH